MKTFCFFILISGCLLGGASFKNEGLTNSSISLQLLMDSLKIEKEDLAILIDKSDYKLSIMAGGKAIKEYPVVFGDNPTDDKLMEGDRRTPEGSFKVRDLYPHKKWSKFIWIDYPNEESWVKHNKARESGEIPKNSKIGGEIGIHGVPAGYDHAIDNKTNWTLGCISLKNKDVNEIYPQVYKGMTVKIQK